jgi:DNA integrity scanning protein DisA with diadenylate cyclase activity
MWLIQRSIEQHEQSSDNPSISPVNTTTNSAINSRMKEQLNNKILAVHDQITIIVFYQIDKKRLLQYVSISILLFLCSVRDFSLILSVSSSFFNFVSLFRSSLNVVLKETSSNNNRCTNAIQTQSQNIPNENHCIDADKHETSHTNISCFLIVVSFHTRQMICVAT